MKTFLDTNVSKSKTFVLYGNLKDTIWCPDLMPRDIEHYLVKLLDSYGKNPYQICYKTISYPQLYFYPAASRTYAWSSHDLYQHPAPQYPLYRRFQYHLDVWSEWITVT